MYPDTTEKFCIWAYIVCIDFRKKVSRLQKKRTKIQQIFQKIQHPRKFQYSKSRVNPKIPENPIIFYFFL